MQDDKIKQKRGRKLKRITQTKSLSKDINILIDVNSNDIFIIELPISSVEVEAFLNESVQIKNFVSERNNKVYPENEVSGLNRVKKEFSRTSVPTKFDSVNGSSGIIKPYIPKRFGKELKTELLNKSEEEEIKALTFTDKISIYEHYTVTAEQPSSSMCNFNVKSNPSKNDIDEYMNFRTNVCCYWCVHPITDGPPIHMPQRYNDKLRIFLTFGSFCSFDCCKSYITEHKRGSLPLLYHYRQSVFGIGINEKKIKSAPPRESLIMLGGHLNIRQFRSSFDIPSVNYSINRLPLSYIPYEIVMHSRTFKNSHNADNSGDNVIIDKSALEKTISKVVTDQITNNTVKKRGITNLKHILFK
jgi:hypothetical protein